MNRPELLILIPCHGLEDFPTDLGESEAAGLLNAFSAAYHPSLIAVTREIPGWRRADDPHPDPAGKIVIVPSACSSWLPHAWAENARASGAAVIEGIDDRDRIVEELLLALASVTSPGVQPPASPSDVRLPIDPELVADFLAFGTAYLQLDLLTRRMHYYSNLDSGPMRLDLIAAADAATAGDADEARRRLKRAFELLLDARERFFPVDAYIIDLCLLIPRLADQVPAALSPGEPTTLLATAADWEEIAHEQPELFAQLKAEIDRGQIGIIGGEYREGPTALAPIESVLWEFNRGLAVYKKLFDRTPKVWARRRYGFSTLIPQILERSNMPYALHAALDDGYYPDDEQSKFRWEGCDGETVDAFSRIPLAADGATSFLRFSQRVAEAMEGDQSAAIMFARWPELSTPWFEDLRRIHRYAPVFGKYVTLEAFFEETTAPGRTFKHSAKEYFAPYLTQFVARELHDPIARFGKSAARRHRFDATLWMRSIAQLLRGVTEAAPLIADEIFAERAPADADADLIEVTDRDLAESSRAAATYLTETILINAPAARGAMIFNPLSFPRRVTVALPEGFQPPKIDGPVKHVQFDTTHRAVTLDLPAAGFHWLPAAATGSAASAKKAEPPTAEDNVLRNEFFEVHVSDATGGIAYVKGYGRAPKRLSQQLAYRFPRKRPMRQEAGDDSSYYSEMRLRSLELTCTGPALAEAVTTGDIGDQTNNELLCRFKQTIRVWRGRPHIELEIELEPLRLPEGDPWSNHYACRFAWNDETAVLTRGVQQTAQPTPDSRFDAPHYVEIAEGDLRTTIVPIELPFHRKTGGRMLDTLLVVAGETRRTFRFLITIDEAYPLRAALDAYSPPLVVPTEHGPPLAGPSGWFLHVDAKNVQITSVRPLDATEERNSGLRVRLLETEGRSKRAKLSCFKTPTSAKRVNLAGETMEPLTIEGDAVLVEMRKYEIATVELGF
jgi:alpha-mannosidase